MDISKEGVLKELQQMMHELFEVPPEKIRLDSRLYEELDLDSIDAVDLIVQLQALTKRKFNPDEFKKVRTVSDVVDVIYETLNKDE